MGTTTHRYYNLAASRWSRKTDRTGSPDSSPHREGLRSSLEPETMKNCEMKINGKPCSEPASVRKNILCSPEDEGVVDWWVYQCANHSNLTLEDDQCHYVASTVDL